MMDVSILDFKGRRCGTLTLSGGPYKAGDPCPTGYIDRQEWAAAHLRAGIRQVRCSQCSRWKFPQQLSQAKCRVRTCLECCAVEKAKEVGRE